jgi:hypothetical protein
VSVRALPVFILAQVSGLRDELEFVQNALASLEAERAVHAGFSPLSGYGSSAVASAPLSSSVGAFVHTLRHEVPREGTDVRVPLGASSRLEPNSHPSPGMLRTPLGRISPPKHSESRPDVAKRDVIYSESRSAGVHAEPAKQTRHTPIAISTPHAHETDREQLTRLTAELERLRPAGRRLLEVSEELGCARSQIAKLESEVSERRTSEAEVQQLRDRLRAEMERSRGLEQRCDQIAAETAQSKLVQQLSRKQERLTRLMYRVAGKDVRTAWEMWKRYMIARSFEAQNVALQSELESQKLALLRAEEQVAAALEAEAKLREIRNSYHVRYRQDCVAGRAA